MSRTTTTAAAKLIAPAICLIAAAFAFGCAPPPEAAAGGPMSANEFVLSTIQFICLALVVYFLLVINPARTRQESHQKFLQNLKKNDEVMMSSGVYARVTAVKPEYLTLEIAPNVRVKVDPQHVQPPAKQVDTGAESPESDGVKRVKKK